MLKISGKDFLIMAAMTLAYLAVALVDLGRLDVPRTGWTPAKAGEGFTVELGTPREIERIYYYCGLGTGREPTGAYMLDYMDSAGRYSPLAVIEKKDIFTWKRQEVPYVRTGRIRVTVIRPGAELLELAFFEKGGSAAIGPLALTGVRPGPGDAGKAGNLFDEQGTVELRPSYLTGMIFDEIYHARTAYDYVHHIDPYDTVHPPLGKDLIALGVLVFGMTPFGWRITGTLVGALMLPVMYMFGKRLFSSRSYGVAAAFLMMFDFMHFTQTRVATVDTFVTIFITLMYYYMFVYYSRTGYEAGYRASLRPLLLCGLFFGLGCATKWNAVYGAPGLLLIFLMAKFREYRDYRKALAEGAKQAWVGEYVSGYLFGTIGWCLVFFILIPAAVYVVSYIPFFLVPGPGHGLSDLPALQSHMYNYHKTLVATHPFQSRWWEWPLMLKPVWFYVSSALPAGRTSTIVALGNPAIWWVGTVAVVFAAGLAAERRDRNMAAVFIAIASLYLPWALVPRIAFIYHFFPILPFMIFCIVYSFKTLSEKYTGWRFVTYGYLALVAALFVLFYPALSGMEVGQGYIDRLKWLKGWYF